MGFSSVITAWVVTAVLVRSHKVTTRSGTVFVNRTVRIATDTAGKSDTFVLVFHFGALHAAICGIQIHSQLHGDFPDAVGLGLAPIEGNAEMSAAGATAQARMLF